MLNIGRLGTDVVIINESYIIIIVIIAVRFNYLYQLFPYTYYFSMDTYWVIKT